MPESQHDTELRQWLVCVKNSEKSAWFFHVCRPWPLTKKSWNAEGVAVSRSDTLIITKYIRICIYWTFDTFYDLNNSSVCSYFKCDPSWNLSSMHTFNTQYRKHSHQSQTDAIHDFRVTKRTVYYKLTSASLTTLRQAWKI